MIPIRFVKRAPIFLAIGMATILRPTDIPRPRELMNDTVLDEDPFNVVFRSAT